MRDPLRQPSSSRWLRRLAGVLLFASFAPGEPAAAPAAGATFRDCPACPEMVVVPAGRFLMGSPPQEQGRRSREGPQRTVLIDSAFAVGKYEVTRAEFAAFLHEVPPDERRQACMAWDTAAANFRRNAGARDAHTPGYLQRDDHPVVCVSWNEAQAYAQWLSRKTGQRYRLLSEAEWEYAARAGSTTSRPWGDDPAQSCRHANLADETFAREIARLGRQGSPGWHACRDGHAYTAPVGRLAANRFGLHDMIGNAWEWVEDCWNESHAGAPAGSGPRRGDCARRVYRGGAWRSYPSFGRSAERSETGAGERHALIGLRVARALEQ